jgi:hypothetical protein
MLALPKYRGQERLLEICRSLIGRTFGCTIDIDNEEESVNFSDPNIVGSMVETILERKMLSIEDIKKGPPQSKPDFYAQNQEHFLEVKAYLGSPGFDISNISSYIDDMSKPNGVMKHLFQTSYLVFEYGKCGTRWKFLSFHCLSVWSLIGYDNTYPLSVQVKRGMWYNLRPCALSGWKDTKKTPFRFIEGVLSCIRVCPHIKDKDEKTASIRSQFEEISAKYTL